jgi:hypothetical protein
VARSSDALAASTQFDVDLGVARSVRLIALPTHNFTSAATVEVDAGTSLGASDVRNGAAVAAWPAGETAESTDGINVGYVLVLPANLSARYWRIKIVDTGNPAGYVQLGRVFIADAYQPAVNAAYGLKLGWATDSARIRSDGGALIHQARPRYRTADFVLPEQGIDAVLSGVFAALHRLGTHTQLYFVFDAADTTHLFRRSFLCAWRELSALEMATFDRYQVPIALVEEL